MGEKSSDRAHAGDQGAPKNGWWWRFTALFMGVPPIAVHGAEEEVEQERAANAKGSRRSDR